MAEKKIDGNEETKLADAIALMAEAVRSQRADSSEVAKAIGDAMATAIKSSRTDATGLSPTQLAKLEGVPKPKRWREIECTSDETGATFSAVVVESKTFANGRIVGLKRYKMPLGVATYRSAGGFVPDGLQILRAGTGAPRDNGEIIPKHDLTPHYLQWRWSEFWQKDLRRFSGHEMKSHLAASPSELAKPWLEGQVKLSLREEVA